MTDRERSEEEAGSSEAGGDEVLKFDVLVRSEGAATDTLPSLRTLDELRPSPESIERCLRWFAVQGVTCHRTDFGLACEAAISTFKEAFGEDALQRDPAGDWQVAATMNLPPEVSDLVAQITISHPPEWFGGRTE